MFGEEFGDIHARRRDLDLALEEANCLAQVLHRDNLQAFHYGGFGRVLGRRKQSHLAARTGADCDGQHSSYGSDRTGQSQFTDHDEILELIRFKLLTRGQHAYGDRQIEARSLFLNIGGREIDRRAPHGKLKA